MPSCEVPTPEATLVLDCPGACSHMSAITIPAGVAPTSVATMAPRIIASGGKSWNHMPRSVCGCRYRGAAIGPRWGYSVVLPLNSSRKWVCKAGPNFDCGAS